MMDERNLRIAFAKIKKDILELKEGVADLSKSKPTVKGSSEFNSAKFDNFVLNVENELKSLNLYVREVEDRVSNISKKENAKDVSSESRSNDKVEVLESKLSDLSEMISEKIDIEINALRLEFTEEIAKIYDRVFSEVIDLKHEMNKGKKKEVGSVKKSVKKNESKNDESLSENVVDEEEFYKSVTGKGGVKNKKDGKLKKVMNWLFVEEEEKELDDIKSQIKNKKDKDLEDLY